MSNIISFMRLLPLMIVGICFVLISGCRSDKPQNGGTVYIHLSKDPERLNPIGYPFSHARPVNQHIFLPLADYDPYSLEYAPVMIDQLPTAQPNGAEGVKYDITITKNATWDDGKPITAYDYLFTIKAAAHPMSAAKAYRSYLANISRVDIDPKNPKKFTVFLEEDNALSIETATNFEIYPSHIYDSLQVLSKVTLDQLRDTLEYAKADQVIKGLGDFAESFNSQVFSREMVKGSGPYSLEQWISDEVVVLTKKQDYWAEDAIHPSLEQGPDRIIYKIIPDETNALSQLKGGNIDVVSEPSADAYLSLKNDTKAQSLYNFHQEYMMRYYFIALNTQHPALSDLRVRQALAHATNVDKFIENFDQGFGKRTVGFINPLKKYYHKDLIPLAFDIKKSADLLSQAGWSDTNKDGVVDKVVDGKKIELVIDYYASGDLGANMGLILKEDAAKAGIQINIIKKDFALTKKENLLTGNDGAVVSAVTQDLAADDPYLRFHSDNAAPGGPNVAMYKSSEADSLINLIRDESDAKSLQTLYYQLQEVLYEDQPFVFLYIPMNRMVSSKNWEVKTSIKRPGFFANTFKYVPLTAK